MLTKSIFGALQVIFHFVLNTHLFITFVSSMDCFFWDWFSTFIEFANACAHAAHWDIIAIHYHLIAFFCVCLRLSNLRRFRIGVTALINFHWYKQRIKITTFARKKLINTCKMWEFSLHSPLWWLNTSAVFLVESAVGRVHDMQLNRLHLSQLHKHIRPLNSI